MYIAPRRRCAGPRGAATWPCVPRRIHAGPARKTENFLFFYLSKTGLKNRKENKKNSLKIRKNSLNCKNHIF